ncbi:thiosulfate oxidation carrier complex protein SoxZ [Chthonobacter rhizosphaerae]|uniref:thiosulfate oxidation carrier complex protein SoxZ n=1 Tax=Chthonobacter rhizosphaerae TaxID=2735553 RepID=UPI0015EFABFD|nr:thiosulfate oxidation carrier complex protein SoxZ [Chthonobacter rhizosphaerae]
METPRVKVPATAKAGEAIIIRALLMHPMESGLRLGPDGRRVPRRIVHRFECTFDGAPVLAWDLEPGVAANPFLEIAFLARRSGAFRFVWIEDGGERAEVEAILTVEA